MKKILLLLTVVSFALLSFTTFQSGKEEILNALKQGSAEQLSKYFDNTIDLKLPNSDEMKDVQKVQAAGSLKNFFANSKIISCEVTSQRELDATMYITGKLQGTTDYNVTVIIKNTGDKSSIIRLRINN